MVDKETWMLSAGTEIPRLGEHDVHVWVIPLDDPDKRRRRELAHLAQGRLLAGYLGVTPAMLEFQRAPGGKPQLLKASLEFNLSHSERLALLAVSTVAVGVDVQAPHPNAAKPWFANRICTARERLSLGSDPQPEELLRLWTRKEAVLKARGEGSYVAVGEIDVLEDVVKDAVEGGWWCLDLPLSSLPEYRAAVAVRRAPAGPADLAGGADPAGGAYPAGPAGSSGVPAVTTLAFGW